MSDLRAALDNLRQQIEALPASGADTHDLEIQARDLLAQSKNTPFEEEARELFSQLSRLGVSSSPATGQVRSLLRRARIRIEIAGDDQDLDEAIDILAEALDLDPQNAETLDLLMQAGQRSSQHALKVQGLMERYGLKTPEAPLEGAEEDDKPEVEWATPPSPPPSASQPLPDDVNIEALMTEIADTYYAGDYARTVELANRLLDADPNHVQALEFQQKADDNLMRGVVPDHRIPFEARVAYNRANSLVRAGNYEEAERLYREAREIAARAGIHSWRDVEQALLEIQDLSLARQLIADGDRLLAGDDWSGALQQYRGALGVVPNYPEAEERIALLRKVQEQFDKANVRLGMISGSLTERARDLVEILNTLAMIRQTLPNSPRLQETTDETNRRIQSIKTQLVDQGTSLVGRVENTISVEEKYRLAEEAKSLLGAAVDLDSADAQAMATLRRAEQLSGELHEGRQLMERAAGLIAQNFDNELAQARQMLSGLRHHAQDQRYQMLVGDLLSRHLERVEAAIDRHDIDAATRWLSICKEDPFRILGRRTELLRLENDIRKLKQRRLMRILGLVGIVAMVFAVIAFLNRGAIERGFFPTDTPTSTASSTATATATATATNTATATSTVTNTATATPTPLSTEDQIATANAAATSAAETQAAIALITATAEQQLNNQIETQRANDLTVTQDEANNNNTSTAAARTQQASQTRNAQTEQAQATFDQYDTLTATFQPPSPTPTLRPSPTPTPEPQYLCRIASTAGNVNIRDAPSGDIIGVFPVTEVAEVYNQERGPDSVIWYFVLYEPEDGEPIEGWVSSAVVREIDGDCPPLGDEE